MFEKPKRSSFTFTNATSGSDVNSFCHLHFPSQVVVSSLARAVPGILNVALLALLLWTAFAILGVSLFKGALRSCTADPALDRDACPPGAWRLDSDISFDSTWP